MLLTALTLLFLGLVLLALGLRGRRIGDEPRCRKCNYNLTGVETNKCPECGRLWNSDTTPRGIRHRNRKAISASLALLLAAAALRAPSWIAWCRTYNWYQLLPTSYLLDSALAGTSRAVDALSARAAFDDTPPDKLRRIVAAALSVQSTNATVPLLQCWIDLLANLDALNRLSPDERRQFREQRVHRVAVRSRPSVRAGDPLPIEIDCTFRAPRSFYVNFFVDVERPGSSHNTHEIGFALPTLGTQIIPATVSTNGLPPGPVVLPLRCTVGIWDLANRDVGESVAQAVKRSIEVPCSVNILPPDKPPVRLLRSESLDRFFLTQLDYRLALVPMPAMRDPTSGIASPSGATRLELTLTSDRPPPAAAAFHVFSRQADGTRRAQGRFVLRKSDRWPIRFETAEPFWLPVEVASKLAVELVFDPEAAAATLDIDAIWAGRVSLAPIQPGPDPVSAAIQLEAPQPEQPGPSRALVFEAIERDRARRLENNPSSSE